MNIGVVGTRNWSDAELLFTMLDKVWKKHPEATLVTGTPWDLSWQPKHNADKLGVYWATKHSIPTIVFPPDWNTYGKAAGPLRNKQIVEASDLIIAFWDGISTGTYNTLSQAFARGIPSWVCTSEGTTYKYDGRKPIENNKPNIPTTKYPELKLTPSTIQPIKPGFVVEITPSAQDTNICKLCGVEGEGVLCRDCRR